MKPLLVEQRNHVAYVTLNRPPAPVVPLDRPMAAVEEDAQTLIPRAPLAVKYAKEAIARGLEHAPEEGLKVEAELSILLRTTEDQMEGARAFQEKRPPQLTGR